MFGIAEMRAVFDDEALIRRYLDVEVALARSQARCSVVPAEAAEAIALAADAIDIDFDPLRQDTELVG